MRSILMSLSRLCRCNVILIYTTLPSAVFQKISTFQTLLYWEQPKWRIILADSCFSSQAMSFKSEGQLWQNQREVARCALIVWELKKVQGKKSEGLRGGFLQSIFLSVIFSPSLPFMVSMLCDLSVRRVTWVLLIDLTPTDRRLTLERSGQMRLGTPATQHTSLSAWKNCGIMDWVMVDRQEHRRAKQSCCQSKAVESSCLEGKHRDGNSFSEPAGDKTG